MTFKNLKISINDQQPLDEVVKELERIGYKKDHVSNRPIRVVVTWSAMGIYDLESIGDDEMTAHPDYTTLAELKEM